MVPLPAAARRDLPQSRTYLIYVKEMLEQAEQTRFRAQQNLTPHTTAGVAMFRKILVPTDGSALSETAAAAAVALARGSGAEIVALSVAQPWLPPEEAGAGPDTHADAGANIDADVHAHMLAAERERALRVAGRRAARVARLAQEAGVPHSLVTTAASSQHDEIIRVALELHCDLIFMAAHGQCGVTRLVAARVPQLVLAYSPLPVILYRGSTEPA